MINNFYIFSLVTALCISKLAIASTGVSKKVQELMSHMTLDEKVGQMTQVNTSSVVNDLSLIKKFNFGSILSAAGNEGPEARGKLSAWRHMIEQFQKHSKIPILYGIDAVHGNASVPFATVFPHNIGLGAANDVNLVKRIGVATAREVKTTGVHWNFAPALSVACDVRWGRTYESFSENQDKVTKLSSAYIEGLQSMGVLACAKHFVGDGGTSWGSTDGINNGTLRATFQIDQGNTAGSEDILKSVHLKPYYSSVEKNVQTIMVSYSSWNGNKMHGNRELINDLLKDEMGFEGIVVSDYQGIFMLNDGSEEDQVAKSINAGIDMAMVGSKYLEFVEITKKLVEEGRIPVERIDDAVGRILTVKENLGLLENSFYSELNSDSMDDSILGSMEHLELAIEAAEKSAVLLFNQNGVLPIANQTREPILLLGEGGHNKGLQSGGWTLNHQGVAGPESNDYIFGYTFLESLRNQGLKVEYDRDGSRYQTSSKYKTALVVISENPYAEGFGDQKFPSVSELDIKLVKLARKIAEKTIIVIFSGRPINIMPVLMEAAPATAVIAAWLPGSGTAGLVNLITGKAEFTGTLPFAWPTFNNYDGIQSLDASGEILYSHGHSANKANSLKCRKKRSRQNP